MTAQMLTATEQLRRYRTSHRIEVDRSPGWDRCDTDSIRVHMTLSRRWFHDQTELRRLEQAAAREALDAGSATFAAPCPSCAEGIPVPHNPSPNCESGGGPHCTCDWCF